MTLFFAATVCSSVVILSPWDIPKTSPTILRTKKITIRTPKTRDMVVIFLRDFKAIALGSVFGSMGWGNSFSGMGATVGLTLVWKSKCVGETTGTLRVDWGVFRSFCGAEGFFACCAVRFAALAIACWARWLLEFGVPAEAAWEKPFSPNGLFELTAKGSFEEVVKILLELFAGSGVDWNAPAGAGEGEPPPKVTPPIVVELLFVKLFFSWSM